MHVLNYDYHRQNVWLNIPIKPALTGIWVHDEQSLDCGHEFQRICISKKKDIFFLKKDKKKGKISSLPGNFFGKK